MFGRLSGSKGAQHGEDSVWVSNAARIAGLGREVDALRARNRSVVLVALTQAAVNELSAALRGRDVPIAHGSALGAVKPAAGAAVDILVYGRNDSRAADDALVAFADQAGANARIVFHLSLEDRLLQAFGSSTMRSLLEKLGARAEEPICHAMVTQAIRNAQEKLSNA